jgi:hypothetical protein
MVNGSKYELAFDRPAVVFYSVVTVSNRVKITGEKGDGYATRLYRKNFAG